ncbi:sulfurtransferase complex subunit TusD [Glaciecola petra]|uniref:Sulfurtransferase complex subunit TusD n=1 Tax=Glaciecola petra TaxID=3075602 RepID=A0ABU2ZNS0_9ALTE|nr:sulfurtransferase complex subunit TusD [Aestuariibacter sp. P117]MDT0594268.1 sulfurtransferase complex subunit TusD [Aestuariibacter sp. P117]
MATDNTAFTLIVTKSPFDSRNAESALYFCKAAIAQGFAIEQVFFYQAGVQNASLLQQVNSDEFDVYQAWLELHEQQGVRLNVCTTAAGRRGIVSEECALNGNYNVNPPFEQVGLSDYFAALTSSKGVQF